MSIKFKGIMGTKAEFDGESVTITKHGKSRMFYVDEIVSIVTSRGKVEFGISGEETSSTSRVNLRQAAKDAYNTKTFEWLATKKKDAAAQEFIKEVRAAQRAARA